MIAAFAAATVIAGCSGTQPPLGASPQGLPQQKPGIQVYRILHEFAKSAGDGYEPISGVIVVKGEFYGTTPYGGTYNDGTVFSITKSGEEKVLYSFGGAGDGIEPASELVDLNGTLYGTTVGGGANASGAVFSITRAGKEKVLYSFPFSANAGSQPWAGLIDVNGTLYGTTYQGGDDSCGSGGCGSVFSITPAGSEKLLYSFGTKGGDGLNPHAPLFNVDGVLYGTTYQGGQYKRGTVFAVTLSGREHVVYSFGKSGFFDGSYPTSGLVSLNGRLYGTTTDGGAAGEGGTVFGVTTSGSEKIVHSFEGKDGSGPAAGLTLVKNILYGTTVVGGAVNAGTVFSVTPTGDEAVVRSFSAGTGKYPMARLVLADGILYGTTYGGVYAHHGNAFSLIP
jgi:uncharacterized repeat protein (TIGR03803 family)